MQKKKTKKTTGGRKKRPHVKRTGDVSAVTESFARYVNKVLQEMHPGLGMSKRTASVMDSLIVDMYSRLVAESQRLLTLSNKKTLSSREIQSAVRLVIPGELARNFGGNQGGESFVLMKQGNQREKRDRESRRCWDFFCDKPREKRRDSKNTRLSLEQLVRKQKDKKEKGRSKQTTI